MIKPLGKNIVVKQNENKEAVVGGIYVGKTDEFNQKAIVIAIGNTKEVSVGQTVLIAKFAGSEISFNNEKYLIVTEEDILAIYENAE